MFFILSVIFIALVFEYINGFHDTANSIATVVSTKVLTPRQAVSLAAGFNLLGALWGASVAATIGQGMVDTHFVGTLTILCALITAILWNLLTWWMGLPSSSSHALIGGLCGATLASAHSQWSVIHWSVLNPVTHKLEGLWPKVILPMLISPVAGIVGFSHGTNDAQKTMGIITLVLYTATRNGTFDHLPAWLHFLWMPEFKVAIWIKVACALTMAAGTAAGGWRIIKTMGHKMVRLQPIHGFAAETTAAAIISVASHWGMPLSTTHVISTSTIPVTALLAYGIQRLLFALGLVP